MKHKHRLFTLLTSMLVMLSGFGIIGGNFSPQLIIQPLTAAAASVDYPAQLLHIGVYDNSKNLNISGYTDNSTIIASTGSGSQNQNWRFDYVGTNSTGSFFKIANMGCGRLLTPMNYSVSSGVSCVVYGSESHTSQHWYVIPISQDKYGNDLYYKIVNYDNSELALTCNSNGKLSLSAYVGSNEQKFLLNSAGLQGFGGYCKDMGGNPKASVIGGVLGETVEVSSFDELKKACTDSTTKTIILKTNISGKTDGYQLVDGYDGNKRYICRDDYIYLGANKTIIGSYGANTLHNVFFRTYEGEAYGQGNNIILRNIRLTHDKELNYDNNWEFSYGWNFWLDHCTFVGHDKINGASTGSPDFDKFINFKGGTNFITISDCNIGKGEYGVLLGYPTDTEEIYQKYNGVPCVTLTDNYYKDTLTRAPGLMRYGYFHSLNNYVVNFDMGYTIYTAAKLYAEGCYYDAGTGKGSVVNDTVSNNDISSKYPGFYTEVNSTLVGSKYSLTAKTAKPCTWKPTSNYSYAVKSANDAKNYCTKYAGAQTLSSNMTYAAFDKAGMPSAGYISVPDKPTVTKATVSGAQNGNVMNADWITEGIIDSALKINDTYSITASTEKQVNVYKQNSTTSDDKYKIGSVIAMGGAGNTVQRSLLINAKSSGTLNVYMSSSNPEAPRNVNLLDNNGNVIQTVENIVGTEINAYIFTIPSGGTYYLTSASSGLNVYYAEIEYGTVAPSKVKGDVNSDGKFNVADVVLMQKWILAVPDITLSDWKAGDLCEDDRIDVFDLCMMKRLLVEESNIPDKPIVTTTTSAQTTTTTTTTTIEKVSYEPTDFKFSGKVYLVGDSTVCDYDSNMSVSYNRYGWGMKFAEQFNGVSVTNLALSGRSSRSFLAESNYQTLKSSLSAGDYLFIQFGHNDEKTDEATYPGLGTYAGLDWGTLDNSGKDSQGHYSYEYILTAYYINLARNKGAVPILITPITRRGSDGKPNYQTHTDYQNGMIELGKLYNVPVIDMTTLTTQLYTNLYNYGGAEETAKMHCYVDTAQTQLDNTHLSNAGAYKIANMIAEQTKKLELSIGDNTK